MRRTIRHFIRSIGEDSPPHMNRLKAHFPETIHNILLLVRWCVFRHPGTYNRLHLGGKWEVVRIVEELVETVHHGLDVVFPRRMESSRGAWIREEGCVR